MATIQLTFQMSCFYSSITFPPSSGQGRPFQLKYLIMLDTVQELVANIVFLFAWKFFFNNYKELSDKQSKMVGKCNLVGSL